MTNSDYLNAVQFGGVHRVKSTFRAAVDLFIQIFDESQHSLRESGVTVQIPTQGSDKLLFETPLGKVECIFAIALRNSELIPVALFAEATPFLSLRDRRNLFALWLEYGEWIDQSGTRYMNRYGHRDISAVIDRVMAAQLRANTEFVTSFPL